MTQPFGTDLWVSVSAGGVVDLDPSMRTATGIQVLAQSIFMRQLTPLGSLIGSRDDGIDLRGLLSKGLTQAAVQSIAGTVRNQILRDQRVKSATVAGQYNVAANTLTLTEQIDAGDGPFTLTLSVSQVTVTAMLNGVPLGSAQ